MTQDEQQAREIAQWQLLTFRARSFRWASALLTAAQRRRVAALYAFCRAVDDLADADWVAPEAQADLHRTWAGPGRSAISAVAPPALGLLLPRDEQTVS